jgi:hypothetical protein
MNCCTAIESQDTRVAILAAFIQRGINMKKQYEKPTLVNKGKLGTLAAVALVSPPPAP